MFDFSMTRMTIWVPMLTNYVLFFRMVEAAKYNHIQFTIFHECVAIKLVSLVEPISNPTFNGDGTWICAYKVVVFTLYHSKSPFLLPSFGIFFYFSKHPTSKSEDGSS